MKDLLTKKRKIHEQETAKLEVGCTVIMKKPLPKKFKDLDNFTLPIAIRDLIVGKTLLDLWAIINLMPLSIVKRVRDVET